MATGGRGRIAGLVALVLLAAAALWMRQQTGAREDGGRAAAARPAGPESPGSASPAPTPEPGTGEATSAPVDPSARIPPPVDLASVDRERDLHGVVVDRGGAPIAGASLTVERTLPGRGWGDQPHLAPQPEPLRAISAKDGSFRFPLEWGEQIDLSVAADGFSGGALYGCPAGARLRVVLARGAGGLEVLVRDGEGRPVADARVTVGGGRLRSDLMTRREGRTGADGRFLADGLPPGQVDVQATHPEYGFCPEVPVAVPVEGAERVEIVLDRGRVVEGRVVDAATGLPVAGARVGRNWVLDRPVTTDGDGRFAFRGWNEVPGWDFGGLHCLADGYARGQLEVPAEGAVEFRLERGFAAAGRIVGHDGLPVPGAEVRFSGFTPARGGDRRRQADPRRTATDAEGRWTQRDLRRGFDYEVWVCASGHGQQKFAVAAPAAGSDRLDAGTWVLPEGRRVEGVVLDAEGRPASGLNVGLSGGPDARVDDRGRFRIADAPPGERSIEVCRPDGFPLHEQKVIVPEGSDLRDLVIRLPAFRRLVVRATDSEGRPLSGVSVWAFGDDSSDFADSGEDGRAVFEHLQVEVVELSAELYDPNNRLRRLPARLEGVRPAGQEVTLVLEEGVAITGTVVGADGKPVKATNLWAQVDGDEEDWFESGPTSERGNFKILVRKGQFVDLFAQRKTAEGAVLEKGTVRQVAGPRSGVEIRLEPVPVEPVDSK